MSFDTYLVAALLIFAVYVCFFFTAVAERKKASESSLFLVLLLSCCIGHIVTSVASEYLDRQHLLPAWQYAVNILYPLFGFLEIFLYAEYFMMTADLSDKQKKILSLANKIFLGCNVLFTLPFIPFGLFFSISADGTYERGALFFFSYVFVFLQLILLVVFTALSNASVRKKIAYSSFSVLPILVSIIMVFQTGYGVLSDVATMLSCVLLFSFVYTTEKENSLQKELQFAEVKNDMMLSQIGPHFIYNTLAAISTLCVLDPQKAQTLTTDFSDYLRTNLNLGKMKRVCAFTEELNHVKKYLSIEKVRFGDRLNVEYDIREDGFMLPSLSLQPIVENAVKHGVTRKENGGTVKIATRKEGEFFAVVVSDNGVGFDAISYEPQKGHYGLSTTRDRLRLLLGGDLIIESTVGVGTSITFLVKPPRD